MILLDLRDRKKTTYKIFLSTNANSSASASAKFALALALEFAFVLKKRKLADHLLPTPLIG